MDGRGPVGPKFLAAYGTIRRYGFEPNLLLRQLEVVNAARAAVQYSPGDEEVPAFRLG